MKTVAMVLNKQRTALDHQEIELPPLSETQVLIKVGACAVCRTDLHVVDGDLPDPNLPLVPGHEIVGRVVDCGKAISEFSRGDRVAVPWLARTCNNCRFCLSGRENLCDHAVFTGYTTNGGFAGHTIADAQFTFKLSAAFDSYSDEEIAPLMCAGLIGWRSFKMAAGGNYEADGRRIGIYGFGAAGHLILQVANYFGWKSFAFTRDTDKSGQKFALDLGACWSGGSTELPPDKLDAAIIFAPVGLLVPPALKALDKGGRLVCGGIYMSDIPQFAYSWLWEERSIISVANLTREDAREFLDLAPRIPVRAEITRYDLLQANEALADLRGGRLNGAAVLVTSLQ